MERIDIFMIVVAAYVLIVTFSQLWTIYKFGAKIAELYETYSRLLETIYASYRNSLTSSLVKITEDFIGDAALARKDFLDGLVSDDIVEVVGPDREAFTDDGK